MTFIWLITHMKVDLKCQTDNRFMLLIHREDRIIIISEVVTRTALQMAAVISRNLHETVRMLQDRAVLLTNAKMKAKIRDCATFANRRIIGSLIVRHVVISRPAQTKRRRWWRVISNVRSRLSRRDALQVKLICKTCRRVRQFVHLMHIPVEVR